MGSKIEECLANARRCEALANDARDTLVKTALMQAARQWRDRAGLIGEHAYASSAGLEAHQEAPSNTKWRL